jgi:hypothetical protein
MARDSESREDLMREATALVVRCEFTLPQEPEPIVVGFRANGCGSIYWGEDPAYHFNSHNELRRAYVGGLLFKAEGRRLVSLRRERGGGAVALWRHELGREEQQALLADVALRADRLFAAIQTGQAALVRQVPEAGGVRERLRRWLTSIPRPIGVAIAPHAR